MENTTDTSSIRVLLADDHAVVRAGIRQFLEHSGRIQVVAEADDGQKACILIEKHCPDVVVLDIQMPEKSGIEVTTWIREHYPAMGVLILTAYDDEPYVRAVLRAGANGYVMKTSTPEEITHAVEEIYAGKAVLDSALTQKLMSSLGRDDKEPVESLTPRELEVLTLAGKGNTNKSIGFQLNISDRTVQNHLAHIFDKLQAASRTEAVMRAVSLGLLPPDLADTMEE
jgi:DNA-binding NarL/FixJ family response regulator